MISGKDKLGAARATYDALHSGVQRYLLFRAGVPLHPIDDWAVDEALVFIHCIGSMANGL